MLDNKKINKIIKSLQHETSFVDDERELIKYEDERILLMLQILETFDTKFENNWYLVSKINWILRNRNNLDVLADNKGQLNI